MPRGGRPGSVDGTDISPESVNAERLFNVHRFICDDSQEFADALTYAENNQGVTIRLGDGIYSPGDHISLPVSVRGGFRLEGNFTGRDSFNFDGILINDPANPSGTILDLGGGTLFDQNDTTGFVIRDFGVRNLTKLITTGEAVGSGDTKGISYGYATNINIEEPGDYAFDLGNCLTFNLQNIVGTQTDTLAHMWCSHSTLQAGNSVWQDVLVATRSDTAPTGPGIYLEARDNALNYMTLLSPQVISGSATGTHPAIKVEGKNGNPAQNSTLSNIDTEGSYLYGVHEAGDARQNHYEYAGNAAQDYQVYLDGAGSSAHANSKFYEAWSGSTNNFFTGRWKTVDGANQCGIYRHADEFVNNDERLRIVPGQLNRRIMFFEEGTQHRVQIVQGGEGLSPGTARSPPSTSEIDALGGGPVLFVSDGTVGNFNDIYAAWNISGTVKVIEVADVASATAP